ncbi:SpoIIE family protein phosphatase [Pseudoflavonifractor capillosus]|nr:SpoIIE family protein phosphatase [Pseudoflavonifractor capillosus]
MPEYQELLELLNQLREDNGVVSLYLGYHELNTMKDLYLVDASAEESCIPGDYDNVEADQVEQLRAGNFDMPAYITNYPDYGWLCSASATIENADGEVIGVALVDISMNEIMGDAQEFLQTLILLIAVVALIMAGLILLLVNRTIVLPINQMARAALQYVSDRRTSEGRSASAGGRRAAAGEEEEERSAISKLNIRTGDEIQALSEAIKTMELEINEYIQDLTAVTAEKERIGAELNVATQIQADMLPRIFPAFPEREEFDVYATMNPAKEVGGDFYDFFLVDDDHLAVVIADVSGKGVPAALFMVIAKTLIKNHAQNQEAPGTVFTQTNEQLCEGNDAGLFVTGWMGVLEISTGKFVYVNAGHNPPLLKRAGGTFEWLKSRPGFVLAGMEGVRYRENTLQLEPGDRLYLYTDGVTEATNSREELFGDERLQNALNEYMDLPVEQFLPKIKECIDAFVGGADQFDDITMLALDYQSKGETEHD